MVRLFCGGVYVINTNIIGKTMRIYVIIFFCCVSFFSKAMEKESKEDENQFLYKSLILKSNSSSSTSSDENDFYLELAKKRTRETIVSQGSYENNKQYLSFFPKNIVGKTYLKPILECFCDKPKKCSDCRLYKEYNDGRLNRLKYLIENKKIELPVCYYKDAHTIEECMPCNDYHELVRYAIDVNVKIDKIFQALMQCSRHKAGQLCTRERCFQLIFQLHEEKQELLITIKNKGVACYFY